MQYYGFVYLWEHRITGMSYVGSHKGLIDDGYVSSSSIFNVAYRLDSDNFVRSILEYDYLGMVSLRLKETSWLRMLRCAESDKYYNRTSSAFGVSLPGKSNPAFGIAVSDERKTKVRESWKNLISEGYVPHNKGVPMSELQKAVLSDTWEITHPNGNIVIVTNMSTFCKEHKLNPSAMSSVARGNRRAHKGFRCRKITNNRNVKYEYVEWVSKGVSGKPQHGKDNPQAKSVVIDGIKYSTIREASSVTGLSRHIIRKKYL